MNTSPACSVKCLGRLPQQIAVERKRCTPTAGDGSGTATPSPSPKDQPETPQQLSPPMYITLEMHHGILGCASLSTITFALFFSWSLCIFPLSLATNLLPSRLI
ncbi:hypothetical protein BKA93DRAFT_778210 [Sparassis latifolia]